MWHIIDKSQQKGKVNLKFCERGKITLHEKSGANSLTSEGI